MWNPPRNTKHCRRPIKVQIVDKDGKLVKSGLGSSATLYLELKPVYQPNAFTKLAKEAEDTLNALDPLAISDDKKYMYRKW